MVRLNTLPSYFPEWCRQFLVELHDYLTRQVERRRTFKVERCRTFREDEWRRRTNSERQLLYERQRAALERLVCNDVEVKRAMLPLIVDLDRPWKLAYFLNAAVAANADYKTFHSDIRRSQELLIRAEALSRQLDEVMCEIAECALSWERYGGSAPYRVSRMLQLDTIERVKQSFESAEEGEWAIFSKARQVSNKTTYLRILAYKLTRSHEAREFCRRWGFRYRDAPIVLNTTIYRAMAAVANVILDDPQVSVSYDDARKAIDVDLLLRLQSDEDAIRLERWLRRNASTD